MIQPLMEIGHRRLSPYERFRQADHPLKCWHGVPILWIRGRLGRY